MNSIIAAFCLIAILSLCNLTEKPKPSANSNSANTNSADTPKPPAESGHESQSSSSRAPATDRAAVTVELMKIEYDLTTASFAGDISTLASFMADDYSGTGADGRTQNKNQILAATKPDKTTKSWKISDGELVSFSDDSAVLTYVQSQTLRDGRTFRARVTDTFVKRNGRWLVKSEQQTLMK